MDPVFPAEHGLLTAAGLPVAESHTQLAHMRPEPFSIYADLRRWLADGMSVDHCADVRRHEVLCIPKHCDQ